MVLCDNFDGFFRKISNIYFSLNKYGKGKDCKESFKQSTEQIFLERGNFNANWNVGTRKSYISSSIFGLLKGL